MSKEILGLVIPCYNEAERLPMKKFENFLDSAAGQNCRLIFVDDGSRDNTSAVIQRLSLKSERVYSVTLSRNCGKGEAVRQGVLFALGLPDCRVTQIGFWDADLATPLEEVENFQSVMEADSVKCIVIGNRHVKNNCGVERNVFRNVISYAILCLINFMLGFKLKDSQCGAKIFRRSVAELCFEQPFVSRWLFDVEIFKRLLTVISLEQLERNLAQKDLANWHEVPGSKLKFYHLLNILCEMLKIDFYYRQHLAFCGRLITPKLIYRWGRKKFNRDFMLEFHFKIFRFAVVCLLFLFIIHDICE